MGSFRIPGPLNVLNMTGLPGFIQLRRGNPQPGPVGTLPGAAQPTAVGQSPLSPAAGADADPSPTQIGAEPLGIGEPVTYREIMAGLQLSVYDIDTGAPMNPTSFNWLVPFRTRGGQWNMEPRPIESALRIERDRIIGLLGSSLLPNHISGMLRRTRVHHAEHKAYITADGNIGGTISGSSHAVGNLTIPVNVRPIAEIHTHPRSLQLAPPSFPDDFRRNTLQLVAEYTHGRLWIAAWPNLALLIGQIVVGVGNDRDARFRPIGPNDPRCDNVFHMSAYVPRSRRIPPV